MENADANKSCEDMVDEVYRSNSSTECKGKSFDVISYVKSLINPNNRSTIQKINRNIPRYAMTDFGSDDDNY